MLEVRLIDNTFHECGPSCGTGQTGIAPKHMKWYIGNEPRDITVFTDNCLHQVNNIDSKIKVAWLIESRAISPHIYENIKSLYDKFDYIFTHDKELLYSDHKDDSEPQETKFHFTPLAGHWIKDKQVYPKTKNLSIIASNKRMTTGHNLRHSIINQYREHMDVYGNGYNAIVDKLEGLKDYRFQIVIENLKYDYWFTEKLIDVFVTGTIPIYYGCPSINNFFNTEGMLQFDDEKDFELLLPLLTEEYYNDRLDVVKENYETAIDKYLTPEDYMFNALLGDL